MLADLSIDAFNRELGSNSPAPGGGSVAALSGALGAQLVAMVCNLSIGKKGYEEHTSELNEVLGEAESLAASLQQRIDLDTEAFNGVMAAFKMPKESEEEIAARRAAIQAGYKEAVQSPLGIANECLAVMKLTERLPGKSNANALSDLGVASQQAYAGLEGAVMNVRINLPSIKDESFIRGTAATVEGLLADGASSRDAVYAYVCDAIGS